MLTSRRARVRAGFTLVELLISMVVLGLVASSIVTVVIRQQRFYRSTEALMETRSQLRQMAAVLPMDLRAVSGAGNDISFLSDSAIEFRSTFGGAVICTTASTSTLVVPPRNTAKNLRLTSWTRTPVVGDSIALYDNGPTTLATDDRWTYHQITAVATVAGDVATGCPSSSRLVQAADMVTTNPAYRFTFTPVRTAAVVQGAPVRLYRRVRYSLYRAADGLSYLGYRDCVPGRTPVCSVVQPIGGPYRAYAAPATNQSGVQFVYSDSLGNPTTIGRNVARIGVVLRGQTTAQLQMATGQIGRMEDSLSIEIAIRNRK
jgi:prepilin-type N-terminal cleavage/methylation domain-containing protein